MPPEITNFIPSSIFISNLIRSFLGTNNIKPEVGLGVVGKNTFTHAFLSLFFTSPLVSEVMNAIAHKPFLGYSITTTSLKALEEEPNIVWNICFRAL